MMLEKKKIIKKQILITPSVLLFLSFFSYFSFIYMVIRASLVKNGEGNGTPLQYSSLENPMDGGALQAIVHEVAKNRT